MAAVAKLQERTANVCNVYLVTLDVGEGETGEWSG